jgi:FixJ family two-component response regulator
VLLGNVRTNPGTVLIVDDDASVRKALRRLFHASGHTVETFASATEFLACELPPDAGCLVLDIRMPGISGLDLQKQLAVRHPDLPVVVITGHGDDEVRQRALAGGAIAVLDKPFDDQALLDAVEQAMARGKRP